MKLGGAWRSTMYLILAAIFLVAILGLVMYVTAGLVALALTLFIAGLIGWAADAVVPGNLPGGWLGAVLTGIIGGFIGQLILGSFGPLVFGYRIIPAFIGALIVAVAAQLLLGGRRRSYRL
jgi:uncharacterized membrane protein YeaQ/YmgE (transglycosylase-associated protein family)